jgi:hypothetical protein
MLSAIRPYIDFYRTVSFTAPSHSPNGFRQIWRGLALGWHAASRYRRLSQMSNEELDRRGLDRASIGRHAYFGDPPYGRG